MGWQPGVGNNYLPEPIAELMASAADAAQVQDHIKGLHDTVNEPQNTEELSGAKFVENVIREYALIHLDYAMQCAPAVIENNWQHSRDFTQDGTNYLDYHYRMGAVLANLSQDGTVQARMDAHPTTTTTTGPGISVRTIYDFAGLLPGLGRG